MTASLDCSRSGRRRTFLQVGSPHRLVIEPTRGLASLQLRAVWEYRELLYFLVWRDVKVRYKQTALGVAWIVLQPVVSMVVFTLLFGGLLKVPSGGVPYPVFAYAALLPWNYFAGALTRVGDQPGGQRQPDHQGLLPAAGHPAVRRARPGWSISPSRSSCSSG